MTDPVATTTEGPPTDGKSVNLIGNVNIIVTTGRHIYPRNTPTVFFSV